MRATMIPALLGLALSAPSAAAAQWEAAPPAERLSLERAIAVALQQSYELAQADAAVSHADGRVREAWATVLPDVSASASYQRNFQVQEQAISRRFVDPTAGPDELFLVRFGADNQWQAGLSLSQPLFQATAFIGVGAADRFRQLERERARGVAQSVVTRVRQAYFDVLLALEQVRLTEQSVERVRQTLTETQALNRAGLASDYDVLRLEVQLGNLEPNLQRARDAVAAATRQLNVTMGRPADAPLAVEGRLHEIDLDDPAANSAANVALLGAAGAAAPDPGAFDRVFATALDARTDLRQVRYGIDLEKARYAVERAEFFPKVTLFGNYSVFASQNDPVRFFGTSDLRTTAFNGGFRVELPVFRGFGRTARMQQATANVRQNEALLALTEEQAASQVRTVLASLQETQRRVGSQRRAVQQAQRGFAIASAEYRAGVGSQLQITDAEVALRQSEFNYAQAVYDYLTARASLDAALGTVPVAAGGMPGDR